MEDLLEELNKEGYKFTRDFILKTCLTLLDKGASYDVSKFRDGTTKTGITDNWEAISDAVKDVKDYLYGKTFIRTDKALPSYLGLIPVIYFRYKYPEKWTNIKGLNSYILRTLLTGSFSGTPDNLINKCVNNINKNQYFNVQSVFGVIREDGRSLDITEDTILSRSYGSKSIHILFNIWYEQFNYTPSFRNNMPQIDHIFPQSVLKSIKMVNPETGARSLMRYKAGDRDQIGNCMLLTANENGAGGKTDTLPEDWFADKDDAYLDMHLIPKDKELWRVDNFEQFIEARNQLIIDKFKYMIIQDNG
ncbi:HNH endonuclease family protein [uncultured Psychrobacter sp.]|uniref:HNH endonuclease family protein n=1 Tax=uncultured Psychrobacter sp. TaxID=259303 RepID=UPI002631D0BB|nr:HNH endonuclease family protein [uncultured Psychrobacter sp.]